MTTRRPVAVPVKRQVRAASPADLPALTDLWEQGWHDAHAAIVPQALVGRRTHDTFARRARENIGGFRVLDGAVAGSLAGLYLIKGDELDQFYVDRSARGTDVAGVLMGAVLADLRAGAAADGWLLCAAGNERAARFYRKTGWHLAASGDHAVETDRGPFQLAIWRFEIDLTAT